MSSEAGAGPATWLRIDCKAAFLICLPVCSGTVGFHVAKRGLAKAVTGVEEQPPTATCEVEREMKRCLARAARQTQRGNTHWLLSCLNMSRRVFRVGFSSRGDLGAWFCPVRVFCAKHFKVSLKPPHTRGAGSKVVGLLEGSWAGLFAPGFVAPGFVAPGFCRAGFFAMVFVYISSLQPRRRYKSPRPYR